MPADLVERRLEMSSVFAVVRASAFDPSWHVRVFMGGPDRRFTAAMIDLDKDEVAEVKDALVTGQAELVRLRSLPLPGMVTNRVLTGKMMVSVVAGPNDQYLDVEMKASTGRTHRERLGPPQVREWIDCLEEALRIGPELETTRWEL